MTPEQVIYDAVFGAYLTAAVSIVIVLAFALSEVRHARRKGR